jgi:hypothetical protein
MFAFLRLNFLKAVCAKSLRSAKQIGHEVADYTMGERQSDREVDVTEDCQKMIIAIFSALRSFTKFSHPILTCFFRLGSPKISHALI